MSFRAWWQVSQWLPLGVFVIFAISCLVTSIGQFRPGNDTFIFFIGIAVGGFGAVSNLVLNMSSNKVERLVLALPERRSLRTRKIIGWSAVALRFTGMGVTTALGVVYAKRGTLFPTAMGFVAAAANVIAMAFSLYKLFVSDSQDEKRRDVVAQGQQFGGWPRAGQQQQYMPLQQQQPYGPPPQQIYGLPPQQGFMPPQQNYGWQPQQASVGTPQPYVGTQQVYGMQPHFGYGQVQPQQFGEQQASFVPPPAYPTPPQGQGHH